MLTKHFLIPAVFSLATAAWSTGPVFSQTSDPAIPTSHVEYQRFPTGSREMLHDESLLAALEKSRYRLRTPAHGVQGPDADVRGGEPCPEFVGSFHENGTATVANRNRHANMALDAQSVRYGYGDRLEPIAASEVSVSQNRIEYQHKRAGAPGPELVEWYVNRPHGIEHGFTLSRPLEAHRDGGPLHLALKMTGDLQAKAAAHGAIAFTAGAEGTVLRYDELHVFDATGKELAAGLDITGNRLSLLVDDSTALYPIIIDPILYSETKLIAGDGTADDIFGFSVASDGSTVVVGAPGDHYPDNSSNLTAVGSVYVYERSGGGFVEHAHLTTDVYSSAFGYDVAVDGDRIVVGDPYSGPGATGSMRVYVRKGDKWTLEDRITFDASSGDALHPGIRFSVDIDGDTIVAGSPFYRPPHFGVTPYPDNYIGTVRVFVPRGDGGHLAFGLSKPSSRRATAPMATRSALLSRSWETPLSSGRLTLTLRPAPARCMSTREPAMCGRNYPSCSPVTRLSGMHSARRWTFQGPRSSLEHPWTIQRTAQTPARCMSTVLVPSTGSSRRTSLPVMVQPTTCLETQSPCRRDRSPSLERPWTTRRQGPTLARPMSSSAMDSPE